MGGSAMPSWRRRTTARQRDVRVGGRDAARRGDAVAAAELGVATSSCSGDCGRLPGERLGHQQSRALLELHPGPGLICVLAEQAAQHIAHFACQKHPIWPNEPSTSPCHSGSHAISCTRGPRACVLPSGSRRGEELTFGRHRRRGARPETCAQRHHVLQPRDHQRRHRRRAGRRLFDEAIAFCGSHGLPTRTLAPAVLNTSGTRARGTSCCRKRICSRHGPVGTATSCHEVVVRLASTHVRLERGESIGTPGRARRDGRDVGYPANIGRPIIAEAALAETTLRPPATCSARRSTQSADGEFRNDAMLRPGMPPRRRCALAWPRARTSPPFRPHATSNGLRHGPGCGGHRRDLRRRMARYENVP